MSVSLTPFANRAKEWLAGHRLALCTLPEKVEANGDTQVILPRKGVLELSRLLLEEDEKIAIVIGRKLVLT